MTRNPIFAASQIYIGYVIDSGDAYNYSKVQVWVPSLNGSYSFGQFQGPGENLGNDFGIKELYELRSSEGNSWYYVSASISSGGNTSFDEVTGNATTQKNVRNFNKVADPNKNSYNSPAYGKSFKWKNAEPASNLLQTGMLATEDGTSFDTSDGMPCGSFCKIDVGTKVIVTKANNGAKGIVLAKYPWADEISNVLSCAASHH